MRRAEAEADQSHGAKGIEQTDVHRLKSSAEPQHGAGSGTDQTGVHHLKDPIDPQHGAGRGIEHPDGNPPEEMAGIGLTGVHV